MVSNIKPWYIILGLSIQISTVVLLRASGSRLSNDISPINSSDEWAFLSLKENVVTGKSLQFSINHFPRLEDALFEEWQTTKKDTSIKSFKRIKPKEKLRLIGSVYEIYIDSIQIKNLQWMIQQKTILGFETSKLVSLIDVGDLSEGTHELMVRIRLKREEYLVDPSNPEINYYAKAYFFIDR
jgi:hypothetical protein